MAQIVLVMFIVQYSQWTDVFFLNGKCGFSHGMFDPAKITHGDKSTSQIEIYNQTFVSDLWNACS